MKATTMRRAVLLLIGILVSAHAWGLSFEPLSMQFRPSGRESIRTFRVTNTQNDNIAVRVRMTTRELETTGAEVRRPADERFTVFPSSLYLAPGQTQAVRVQWRGEPQLDREHSYRIIVEQVAVEDTTQTQNRPDAADGSAPSAGDGGHNDGTRGAGGTRDGGSAPRGGEQVSLDFIYRYIGAVYVGPADASPEIVFEGSDLEVTEGERASIVTLEFTNRGGRHSIVRSVDATLRALTTDGTEVEYELNSSAFPAIAGKNFLAGATIRQPLRLPGHLNPSSIELEYHLESAR